MFSGLRFRILLFGMGLSLSCRAEVILDGSVGPAGEIALDSQQTYQIDSGLGKQVGGNLFHSFGAFNLETGTTALFTDNSQSSISNIFARITGGDPSFLDGTLKSAIPAADFYFINPAGVTFGAHAHIDVPGAFYTSTAHRLMFQDGSSYDATAPSNEVLTSAAPQAFGFLDGPIGTIRLQDGVLDQEGRPLHLVGGDIELEGGSLVSAGGQITLNSAASSGQVDVDDFEMHGVESFGNVTITQGRIDSSGIGDNRLRIEAGNITATENSELFADNEGDNSQSAPSSVIAHGSMTLDNSRLTSDSYGGGDSGGLEVNVGNDLNLLNGGGIQTAAAAFGRAGNITVAAKNIFMSGEGDKGFARIASLAVEGSGDAGNVTINAGRQLSVIDGAAIGSPTFSSGHGGDVNIAAGTIMVKGKGSGIYQTAEGDGDAGSLNVWAKHDLSVMEGAVISGSAFYGNGKRGDVKVQAGNILLDGGLLGKACEENCFTGITASSEEGNNGATSLLQVHAENQLAIFNGAKISGATWTEARGNDVEVTANKIVINDHGSPYATGITTEARPGSSGDAGNLDVQVKQGIQLLDGGEISAVTEGSGKGGDVFVSAADLNLKQGSKIEARSETEAEAGSVTINPAQKGQTVNLMGNGKINVESKSGDAGDVKINSGQWLYLLDSAITTSAREGLGNGGNILIDGSTFVILNKSQIVANAYKGHGGNIDINTGFFLPSTDSRISASSEFGLQGTISIQSQYSNIASSIAVLPSQPLDASNRLRDDCAAANAGGNSSSFVIGGRGALPLTPDGLAMPGLQSLHCGDRF